MNEDINENRCNIRYPLASWRFHCWLEQKFPDMGFVYDNCYVYAIGKNKQIPTVYQACCSHMTTGEWPVELVLEWATEADAEMNVRGG